MQDLDALLEQFDGDYEALARHLHEEAETREEENYDYRQQRRRIAELLGVPVGRLEAEIEEVRRRADEAGGDENALSDEDYEAWQAYQNLGTPEEIESALEAGEEARQQLDTERRERLLREAGEAHGANPDVLRGLAGDDLTLEVREVEDDESGETRQVAFVINGDDDATPLPDYAEEHWEAFLPALFPEDEEAAGGTRMAKQTSGKSKQTATTSIVDTHIERMSERSTAAANPLARE